MNIFYTTATYCNNHIDSIDYSDMLGYDKRPLVYPYLEFFAHGL